MPTASGSVARGFHSKTYCEFLLPGTRRGKYGVVLKFIRLRITLVCMNTPIDLIRDLRASGLTDAKIAERCGTTQPTIWRIAAGESRDPRYSIVRAIADLHASVCGPDAERSADAAA